MNVSEYYIESVKKQFLYYKTIAEKAMDQLEPEQLFYTNDNDTNSIAVIVKHLYGNMLSRWTDFLTTDGEKEWRNRDDEFENDWDNKELLMQKWEEGWKCLFTALDSITPENLNSIIYIRNEGHAVIEAINRQLAHYPYHIGQIIFYAKQLKSESWNSLSIPKNQSKDYNKEKFTSDKTDRNFIDEALKKLNNLE
ncbi:MAG: hypothetical protein BM557_11415 [Flavobacterium sp. MedPE-SWcel]|uniref:DUF1572 family protein n=1 Tax=uncultured Flavobacterium sp. TaxID=165435 RepID=UPI000912FC31|nr:DUF1572 family protein [uncultured Flavobacterium sp.]OIQ15370.1 MAG: hypothetical protein BM557_11415 [Flavobacterium sp. MedPE-SWcel]